MASDVLVEAARLTVSGFRVLPVPHKKKGPALKDWTDLRLDAADLPRYFNGKPSNLGVLNGKPSGGLVDVDLDCHEARAAGAILLPPTNMTAGRAASAKDGPGHYWYRVGEPPAKARNAYTDPTAAGTGKAGGLILEILSTGSQTVVPPSVLPADAAAGKPEGPCVWFADGDPAEVPMADLRHAVGAVAAAALLARHWPAGVRHDLALAVSGGLLRAGWRVGRVEVFVRAVCAAAGDGEGEDRVRGVADTAAKLTAGEKVAGWPRAEKFLGLVGPTVVQRVREWLGVLPSSAPKAAAGGPRPGHGGGAFEPPVPLPEASPVPPFPLDIFPAPLAGYWRAAASALNVPVEYVAVPAIAVLGAAVGQTRAAQVKPGYDQSPLPWVVVVGPPGSAKSAALAHAQFPLIDAEREWRAAWDAEVKEFDRAEAEFETRYKEWKKRPDGDPPDRPARPVLRQSLLDDATTEAAGRVLRENPRGLVLLKDELIGFTRMLNQYKGGKGNDKTFYLTAWNGRGMFKGNRSKDHEKGPLVVTDPFIAVGGMICPDTLSELRQEFGGAGPAADGWADRFLLCYPDPLPLREETWETVPDHLRAGYARVVDRLLALEMSPVEGRDGAGRPFVVQFDPSARRAWGQFTQEAARRANGLPDNDGYRGVLSKLKHYLVRFASLLHTLDEVCGTAAAAIDGGVVDRAAELVWYFEAHGQRCLGRGSNEVEPARQMLAVLAGWESETVSKRELYRRLRGRTAFRKVEQLNAPLKLLVAHGYIYSADPDERPGRPTERYGFNPLWDRSKSTSLGKEAANMAKTPNSTGNSWESDPLPGDDQNSYGRGQNPADGGPGGDPPPNPPGPSAPPPGPPAAVSATANKDLAASDTTDVTRCDTTDEESFGHFVHIGHVGTAMGHREPSAGYTQVADGEGLARVATAVTAHVGPVGLDTETTGLDSRTARVRLLQLAVGPDVFLIDLFAFPNPAPALADLFAALTGKEVVGHNIAFDLRMLAPLGFVPGRVFDTMLASQVLHAGERTATNAPLRHGLDDAADRELGHTLDKSHQKADWSKPLTPAMLAYAAADAAILVPLAEALVPMLDAVRLSATAEVEMRALPGVAWAAPVAIDRPKWLALAAAAAAERDRLAADMDALAPHPNGLPGMASRNWNSPKDVAAAFAAVGVAVQSTDDDALAGIAHPLAEAMRQYRSASKRTGTYGKAWLDKHARGDEVLCRWNQHGAESGRMSAADPNLQQIPHDADYRKCFVARPGMVLVKADYSQIELRIAAKVADEPAMIEAYRAGKDLHALTAASVLGKPLDQVTKADRQLAKAVNFGLLFGMGWRGLRNYAKAKYGVVLTDDQARVYRDTFFRTYPKLRRWHTKVGGHVDNLFRKSPDATHEGRTLGGRRRVLPAGKGKAGSKYPNVTDALNFPVQGTAADGMKAAVALLWDRRHDCPGVVPMLFVHDEIVVEIPVAQTDTAAAWLKQAMIDGMAPLVAPVPVEVEVVVGPTWGG